MILLMYVAQWDLSNMASALATVFYISWLTLYSVIVLFGSVGNFLVAFVVFKTKSTRSTTNLLLANMAVADFTTLTVSPVLVALSIQPGLGELTPGLCYFLTACVILGFITSAVSILTLIILAVERYNALIHPLNNGRRLTEKNVGYAIAVTWLSCAVLYAPLVSYFEYGGNAEQCHDFFSIEFLLSHEDQFIVEGIVLGLIFLVMAYCYFHILKGIYITKTVCSVELAFATRADLMAKKKLAMMSFSVTIAFFMAYLPYIGFQFYLFSADTQEIMKNYDTLTAVLMTVLFCFQANSFVNPFLYALQSTTYRDVMKRIFSFR